MNDVTRKLEDLRPVTFHLEADPRGVVQYGLIAEEVDEVYPELVIRDTAGKIQGVRYDELAPMLLNRVQQQSARLERQDAQLNAMRHDMADLQHAYDSLRAAVTNLAKSDQQVAKR